MKLFQNHSLKKLHTFGTQAHAEELVVLESREEIITYIRGNDLKDKPLLILGEGSNILFSGDFNGRVLKIDNKGIKKLSEDDKYVIVKVEAGENWDEFVSFCVDQSWGGLENLSLIPGHVGTSPIQNIGAYGVEMNEYFLELEAIDIETGETSTFSNDECRFSYRNSIFKQVAKSRYIILSVTWQLNKNPSPILKYIHLKNELKGRDPITIRDVREAVIRIRQSKLPDPADIGNAGSFFKNPVISNELLEELEEKYRGIPCFPVDKENSKVPAAWLIEMCGWRGKRVGDAGVYDKQALVLVNWGKATGKDILALAEQIRTSVFDRFGIELEPEVNVI
jgi:UDP-N-acetylmuramate dehydrogenase